MPYGYNGQILRVNLSQGTASADAVDELFCRKYLGGAGFISYFLLKELRPGIDPLGPENKLIFALTGNGSSITWKWSSLCWC